ncbi:MAG: hypothetical protein MUF47_14345 [Porphyrobacter sp.]|jgi:hypothetical protein|nr:hypothetical protein [Porphyrobacter sp.]
MPEWLDVVMWTRALNPWRTELLLAAMVASIAVTALVTMRLRQEGPQMFGNDPPWIIARFGIAGLWGAVALYWLFCWWLAIGPIFSMFLLGMSIWIAVQYLIALRNF